MKKTIILALVLSAFSLPAAADTIIFKDGMRVDAPKVWKSKGEVKCEIGGIVFGYPKSDVARILKGSGGSMAEADSEKEASSSVTVVSEKQLPPVSQEEPIGMKKPLAAKKQTKTLKKDVSVPRVQPLPAKKEVLAFNQPAAVLLTAAPVPHKKRKVPAKQKPVSKEASPKKAAAPQYARIPAFKTIINEDDSNPPVYLKRRRVLLVSREVDKARIRALLLSYEKKLRNELNAQKAQYKMIVVWAYDDVNRADEGAAGWIGMITNTSKAGQLSDNPILTLR